MPFKSKAQQRFMFAAEERGELPPGTARRWAHHTPNIKKLPEHKKESSMDKLASSLYWLGVEKYMSKLANDPQVQGWEMGYVSPKKDKTLYEKFLAVKHRHDPYFSLGAGGAIGALAGSTKGKLMTGVGGGLGAIVGHHLAKKD